MMEKCFLPYVSSEVLPLHDRAGRIIRERQYQHFCSWSYLVFQVFHCKLEIVLKPCGDGYCNSACKLDERCIADKARLYNKDFITGIDNSSEGKVYSL